MPEKNINDQELSDVSAGAARQPQDVSPTGPGNDAGNPDGPSLQHDNMDAQNINAGAARQQQNFGQTGGPDPNPSDPANPSIGGNEPTEIDGGHVSAGAARPQDLSTGPGGAQTPESQSMPHIVPPDQGPALLGEGDASNVSAGAAVQQDIGATGPGGSQSTPDIKVHVQDSDLTDASGQNQVQTEG